MTRIELEDILEKHKKWVNGEADGKRADLRDVSLRGVDLQDSNLRNANLCGVDLRDSNLWNVNLCGADLCYANLCYVYLCYANLRGAGLHGADLHDTDLRNADLCDADLRDTDLRGANLRDANLHGVDLRGADLRDANLSGAKNLPYIPTSCPDSGSFTAWKKANGYIVKLLIPEDARRSSATGRKCRCDKAIVVAIETVDGVPTELNEIASSYDKNFVYRIGETVVEPNFCEDRFVECAAGIHFFINRQEAVDY